MATIKQWLTEAGFNWQKGTVIIHDQARDEEGFDRCPGWTGVEDITERYIVDEGHPLITHEFDDGLGGPECPRFVAQDGSHIYFPQHHCGATSLCKVCINMTHYLEEESTTPYPGG